MPRSTGGGVHDANVDGEAFVEAGEVADDQPIDAQGARELRDAVGGSASEQPRNWRCRSMPISSASSVRVVTEYPSFERRCAKWFEKNSVPQEAADGEQPRETRSQLGSGDLRLAVAEQSRATPAPGAG